MFGIAAGSKHFTYYSLWCLDVTFLKSKNTNIRFIHKCHNSLLSQVFPFYTNLLLATVPFIISIWWSLLSHQYIKQMWEIRQLYWNPANILWWWGSMISMMFWFLSCHYTELNLMKQEVMLCGCRHGSVHAWRFTHPVTLNNPLNWSSYHTVGHILKAMFDI